MAADEENALPYAREFVSFTLLRTYSPQAKHDPEAEAVAECVTQTVVPGELSSDYNYIKEWVEKVDWGGLFFINKETFRFFKLFEVLTRFHLAKQ